MFARIIKTVAAACLVALVLGACGGDDSNADAASDTKADTTADQGSGLDSAMIEDPGALAGDSAEFCAIYEQISSATDPDEFFGMLADAEAAAPTEVADDMHTVADALGEVEDVMRRNFDSDSPPSEEDLAALEEVTTANAEVDARLIEYCAAN